MARPIHPVVVGTAGHIDHGKSSLVQALTGIDPDRLKEEQERGLTIDLGFARLKMGDGRWLGIVDVPGHERFVRNMVAGCTGIDLALLVVAADDGVMPQTTEHVDIIDVLGVRQGMIAMTKWGGWATLPRRKFESWSRTRCWPTSRSAGSVR